MTTKTEIGQCKDCRYWDKAFDRMGNCRKSFPDYPTSGFGYWNERGWWKSDVLTGKNFGCVHWEAKDGSHLDR